MDPINGERSGETNGEPGSHAVGVDENVVDQNVVIDLNGDGHFEDATTSLDEADTATHSAAAAESMRAKRNAGRNKRKNEEEAFRKDRAALTEMLRLSKESMAESQRVLAELRTQMAEATRNASVVHATVAELQPSSSHTAPSVATSSASNPLETMQRDRDEQARRFELELEVHRLRLQLEADRDAQARREREQADAQQRRDREETELQRRKDALADEERRARERLAAECERADRRAHEAADAARNAPSTSAVSETRTTSSSHRVGKPPEYKKGQELEAWLARMSDYMANANITSTNERASTLAISLSQEAYQAVYAMNLSLDERTNGDLYVEALRRKFADRKTPEAYMSEFRACKQDSKEDAGAYLDRLVDLARKAYEQVFKEGAESARLAFVRPQFVEGLRRSKVREWVAIDETPTTIDALRVLALKKEHMSHVLDPPKANDQAKSNAARASNTDESDDESDTESNSSSKAKGHKRHNKAGAKPNRSSGTCAFCKNRGHSLKECRKLQAALGQSTDKPKQGANAAAPQPAPNKGSSTTCFRCGKAGHKANDCFSARNTAGEWLPDNGRRALTRTNSMNALVPAAAADEPKPAPANPAPQAGSHLNAARDVHAVVARPASRKW
jgi:hypothetical protein